MFSEAVSANVGSARDGAPPVVMNVLPNARYERKLIAPGFTTDEVLSMLRRHPAGFRETYPDRVVNNIYLDSPALVSYYEHVNGCGNRVKIRVRWYGEARGRADEPRLEEKLKRGAVSGKRTHPLPALVLNGHSLNGPLEATFDAALLPKLVRANLRQLKPT